jgi:hypothetical protein
LSNPATSHDDSTLQALEAIRRLYDAQRIRSIELGLGERCAVLVVDFQHLYTRGRASTGLQAVEHTATLIAQARRHGVSNTPVMASTGMGSTLMTSRGKPGVFVGASRSRPS